MAEAPSGAPPLDLVGEQLRRAVEEIMKGLDDTRVRAATFRRLQQQERKVVIESRLHYLIVSGRHIIFFRPEPEGEEYQKLFPVRRGETTRRVTRKDARFVALVFRRWGRLHDGAQCLLAAAMSGAPYPALAPRVARFAVLYFPTVVFDRFVLHPGFGWLFSKDVCNAFLRLGWHRVGFVVRGEDEYDLRRAFEGLYYAGTDGMGNSHYYLNVERAHRELLQRLQILRTGGARLIKRQRRKQKKAAEEASPHSCEPKDRSSAAPSES